MSATFTFDPIKHEYRVGDRRLPSVTEVIRAVVPGWQADPWYLERGTALHLACRYLDEHRLDDASVDREIRPRLSAWRLWKHLTEVGDPIAIEQAFANYAEGYAGTVDRVYDMGTAGLLLVDIKSSYSPQVRLQLGAYAALWNWTRPNRWETKDKIREAVAVELGDDGTFRVHCLSRSNLNRAWRQFNGALSVYGFMLEHNLLPRKENDR